MTNFPDYLDSLQLADQRDLPEMESHAASCAFCRSIDADVRPEGIDHDDWALMTQVDREEAQYFCYRRQEVEPC